MTTGKNELRDFGIKDGWSWEKLLLEVELQCTHVMANKFC